MYLLMGLGAAFALGTIIFDDDDTDANTDSTSEGFKETEDGVLIGSSGNDTLTGEDIDTQFDDRSEVSIIDGKGGDDVIDLIVPEPEGTGGTPSDELMSDVDIFGGDGDDLISVSGDGVFISGGEGNDTITVIGVSNSVDAGAGDDHISIVQSSSNSTVYNGGDGDDVIDASRAENGVLNGGAGDDLIISGASGSYGDGYVLVANGGEGEDTIKYNTATGDERLAYSNQVAYGGEGADLFEVAVDEGREDAEFDPLNSGNRELTYIDDSTVQIQTLDLPDFEPGVDTIELDVTTQSDDYALGSARMEESGGSTDLILSFESENDWTREVVVTMQATGVTWNDIELIGADPSVLVPLA